MIWSEKHKEGAAQVVVNSREFCGDEIGAIKQYADDNNLQFPKAQLGDIIYMADKIWRNYQKQARIDPKYYK